MTLAIPVRNIYYLLLYAWGHFKGSGVENVGADESPDLPTLLAKVLIEGVNRLIRRGLDRGYLQTTEETRTPRGRLRLDLIAKRQTLLRGIAVCDVDELTPEVLHNQIIKSTLLSLSNCDAVSKSMRHDLSMVALRMSGVSTVRLSADLFHRVQLSRNTSQYSFLMRVCELIFHSLLPDSLGAGAKFQSVVEDDLRMPSLFEDFLRNFYSQELDCRSVGSEIMKWDAEAHHAPDLDFLPAMKTDITIRFTDRIIIADAKFYKDALKGGRYSTKVQSAHLYQLSAYLAHMKAKESDTSLAGVLIYPANGQSIRLHYRLLGVPVSVVTVNLASDWRDIHHELLDIVSAFS